jgi:hypothetical protein
MGLEGLYMLHNNLAVVKKQDPYSEVQSIVRKIEDYKTLLEEKKETDEIREHKRTIQGLLFQIAELKIRSKQTAKKAETYFKRPLENEKGEEKPNKYLKTNEDAN